MTKINPYKLGDFVKVINGEFTGKKGQVIAVLPDYLGLAVPGWGGPLGYELSEVEPWTEDENA